MLNFLSLIIHGIFFFYQQAESWRRAPNHPESYPREEEKEEEVPKMLLEVHLPRETQVQNGQVD